MSTTAHPHLHRPSFTRFDSFVARRLGCDMRMLYGMAGPILVIVGLLVVLAFHPHAWIVAGIMVVEVIGLALVVAGIFGVMDDREPDQPEI